MAGASVFCCKIKSRNVQFPVKGVEQDYTDLEDFPVS